MSHETSSGRRTRWMSVLMVAAVLALQMVLGTPPAAAAFDCKTAPSVERTDSGMSGAIDPREGQGHATGVYVDYGYAGQVWNNFDVGNETPLCTDPSVEFDTYLGNRLFDVSKVQTATTNALHYFLMEGGFLHSLDDVVTLGADASVEGFGIPFLSIGLLLAAIIVFASVMRGDNAGALRSSGRVLIALFFVGMAAAGPLVYAKAFSGTVIGLANQAQEAVDKVAYPGDDLARRNVLPETMHRHLVWNPWLRGEFGTETDRLASDVGPQLAAAQACSLTETVQNTCDVPGKQRNFVALAERIRNEGNYDAFTGESTDRIGEGLLAATQATLVSPMQIVSKLGVLFAQVIVAFAVIFSGVIGLLCLWKGVARRVFTGIAGVAGLGIVFFAAALLHQLMLVRILESAAFGLLPKLAIMAVATLLMWAVLRPVKRMKQMTAAAIGAVPGENARRLSHWVQHARMMNLLKQSKSRGKNSGGNNAAWWLSGHQYADVSKHAPEREPKPYRSGPRPEAVQAALPAGGIAAAGLLGAARRPGAPPTGGAALASSSPGDRPPAAAPAPGRVPPIRAEATRVWQPSGQPDRGLPTGAAASGQQHQGLPSTEQPLALPPGHRSEAAPAAAHDAPAPPAADEDDLLTPSRVWLKGEGPGSDLTPATEKPTGSFQVYKPSTGQIEHDTAEPRPPRPEARPDTASTHTTTDTPKGSDDDADSH